MYVCDVMYGEVVLVNSALQMGLYLLLGSAHHPVMGSNI